MPQNTTTKQTKHHQQLSKVTTPIYQKQPNEVTPYKIQNRITNATQPKLNQPNQQSITKHTKV